MKLRHVASNDDSILVQGFGYLTYDQIKARIKTYCDSAAADAAKEEWGNVAYYCYQNGVLKAMIEAIRKYEEAKEPK